MKMIFDSTKNTTKLTIEDDGKEVVFAELNKNVQIELITILEEFTKMLKSVKK